MITVSVVLQVDPTRLDYFMECAREQAAASATEPGCRRFEVSRKLDDPAVFTFQEKFDDADALQAHYATPHFARWLERTKDGLILSKTAVRGEVIAG